MVCRQLNYTGLIAVNKSLRFGPGMGPIWLDDVDCTGRESSIGQCQSQLIGEHNCGHNEDVGVICGEWLKLLTTQCNSVLLAINFVLLFLQ